MSAEDIQRLERFRQLCRGIPPTITPPKLDPPLTKLTDPTNYPPTSYPPFIDDTPRSEQFDDYPYPPLDPKYLIDGDFREDFINRDDPRDTLTDEFVYEEPPITPGFMGTPPPRDPTIEPPPPPPDPPDDPPDIIPPPPPPPPPPPSVCPNYHSDHSSVPGKASQAETVRQITAYVNSKGYRHDPDGIPWIAPSQWVPWDGTTTINPCTSTKQQIFAFVFPAGANTMRGLRELFYQKKPYADNSNPTVAEIENWNIEVIRHFRRLLGFNQTTHPVSNDKCTFLKAGWAEERARSNHWTATYPGTMESGYGPCTIPFSSNSHCGASFLPNATDQAPYLCPPTMAACGNTSGAEGIQNINTDIPWSIKLVRIIASFLSSDGIGAHTGPFIGREFFGSAWFMNGGSTTFRGKWSGKNTPTCP